MTNLETCTLLEAASILGISKSQVYRQAAKGSIPGAFKIGGTWRVSLPALKEFLANPQTTVA